MNREEAIKFLTIIKKAVSNFEEYGKAIDMAIEALSQPIVCKDHCIDDDHIYCSPKVADRVVEALSAKPEPLSDAYVKAVWTWLLNYQVEAAELKGKYTPYEVLSWVAHDWRKEHE